MQWKAARVGLLMLCLLLSSAIAAWAAPHQQQTADLIERVATIKRQTPSLTDHFRQDDGRWNTETDAEMARFYRASTLHVNILAPQTVGWSVGAIDLADFYLEVDAFHAGGPLDNEYGVIFRYVDSQNFYLFGASHDGYYILQKMVDGEWVDLVEWTQADILNTGEHAGNTLGVLAEGEEITILLNGEPMATVADDSFAAGQVALMAGTFDEGNVEVAFDDLFVWDLALPPTSEPVVTPTATTAPTPATAELAGRLAAIRAQQPLVSDDFRRDDDLWPTTTDENVAYAYVRRTYRITVKIANWLGFAFNREVEDRRLPAFLAEVEVSQVAGPANGEYGLIFHYQDGDNFYLYAVNGLGNYSLWKKVDGSWTNLIDWTESEALDTGETATNALALLVEAGQITLLANESVLAQYAEEAPFSGAVGLMAGTFDEPGVEIAFDNFVLWPLTEVEPESELDAVATPTPVDVSARLAEIRTDDPTFSDDFRRNDGRWSMLADDAAAPAYVGRTYQITVNSANWLAWSFPALDGDATPADLLVEVDVELVSGPADAEAGLVFRYVDQRNFYLFAIRGLQSYSLWKKVDDEWQAIIGWTESTAIAIDPGSINRLGVLVQGDQITLLVNDDAIDQVTDDTFADGSVGLAVGTFDEAQVVVAFDNFDLWVLSAGEEGDEMASPATPDAAAIAEQMELIRQAEPIYTDDFRRDTGIWVDPGYDDVTFAYAAGAYRITVDAPNITPSIAGDIVVDDFLLEVEASQRSGPTGQYGIAFRQQDGVNFYLYVITPTGLYSFWKMVEGEWRSLIPWMESEALNQGEGELNRLGVLAEGPSLTLLVNGEAIAQIQDDSFASGQIALAAGTFDEAGVEAEFDNLNVWALQVTAASSRRQ